MFENYTTYWCITIMSDDSLSDFFHIHVLENRYPDQFQFKMFSWTMIRRFVETFLSPYLAQLLIIESFICVLVYIFTIKGIDNISSSFQIKSSLLKIIVPLKSWPQSWTYSVPVDTSHFFTREPIRTAPQTMFSHPQMRQLTLSKARPLVVKLEVPKTASKILHRLKC